MGKGVLRTRLLLTLMISLIIFSGCQERSANPDSEKIKQLEEELVNLKLQTEQNSAAIAEQKRDLEIIKEHVVPSYKAQIPGSTEEDSKVVTESKVHVPPPGATSFPTAVSNTPEAKQTASPEAKPAMPAKPAIPATPAHPAIKSGSTGVSPMKIPAPGQPMPNTAPVKATNKVSYSASVSRDILAYNTDSYSHIKTAGKSPLIAPENFISKKEFLGMLNKNYSSTPLFQELIENYKGSKNNTDKEFNPNDPLTREEMVAFTEYFIKGEPDYLLVQTTPDYCVLYLSTFITDGERVSLDYSQLVYRNLCESELINQVFHTFDENITMLFPQRPVTRDQAYKGIQYLKKEFASKSPEIIKNVKTKKQSKKTS